MISLNEIPNSIHNIVDSMAITLAIIIFVPLIIMIPLAALIGKYLSFARTLIPLLTVLVYIGWIYIILMIFPSFV